MEEENREWRGSPLDMAQGDLDPNGIQEFVIEFDNGDSDVFKPRLRGAFQSYEIHMMAAYLDTIAHGIRKGFNQ